MGRTILDILAPSLVVKRFLVMLLLFFFAPYGWAGRLADARLTLAKWGFVHCLHTYSKDDSTKHQAGLSGGGYFQLGDHDDPTAYDNVMRYVKKNYPLFAGSSQQTDEEMTLSACLNLFSSPAYSRFIRTQDKFVDK